MSYIFRVGSLNRLDISKKNPNNCQFSKNKFPHLYGLFTLIDCDCNSDVTFSLMFAIAKCE